MASDLEARARVILSRIPQDPLPVRYYFEATRVIELFLAERERLRAVLQDAPPIANCNTPGYVRWFNASRAALETRP